MSAQVGMSAPTPAAAPAGGVPGAPGPAGQQGGGVFGALFSQQTAPAKPMATAEGGDSLPQQGEGLPVSEAATEAAGDQVVADGVATVGAGQQEGGETVALPAEAVAQPSSGVVDQADIAGQQSIAKAVGDMVASIQAGQAVSDSNPGSNAAPSVDELLAAAKNQISDVARQSVESTAVLANDTAKQGAQVVGQVPEAAVQRAVATEVRNTVVDPASGVAGTAALESKVKADAVAAAVHQVVAQKAGVDAAKTPAVAGDVPVSSGVEVKVGAEAQSAVVAVAQGTTVNGAAVDVDGAVVSSQAAGSAAPDADGDGLLTAKVSPELASAQSVAGQEKVVSRAEVTQPGSSLAEASNASRAEQRATESSAAADQVTQLRQPAQQAAAQSAAQDVAPKADLDLELLKQQGRIIDGRGQGAQVMEAVADKVAALDSASSGNSGSKSDQSAGQSFAQQLSQTAQAQSQQVKGGQDPHLMQMQQGLRPGGQGWGSAVGERVVWLAGQNNKVAEIQLDPPELGQLQVRVQVSNDQVSLSFNSPHASVRDALEQSMPRLREMFAEQGLQLSDSSVSDQQQGGREDSQRQLAGEGQGYGGSDGSSEGAAATTAVSGRGVSLVDYYA